MVGKEQIGQVVKVAGQSVRVVADSERCDGPPCCGCWFDAGPERCVCPEASTCGQDEFHFERAEVGQ